MEEVTTAPGRVVRYVLGVHADQRGVRKHVSKKTVFTRRVGRGGCLRVENQVRKKLCGATTPRGSRGPGPETERKDEVSRDETCTFSLLKGFYAVSRT